jgi:hypothetical protein
MPTWNRFAPAHATIYKGAVYIVNGVNQPQAWDGLENGNAYNLNEIAPNLPATLASDATSSQPLVGTYQYYYTWVRAATDALPEYESGPSPISTPYTISGTEGIDVSFTDPVAAGYDKVRIYRQGGTLAEVYFVAEVATGTSLYNDVIADVSILNNEPLDFAKRTAADGLPPKFRFILSQDGRLIGAGPSGDELKVYVSRPFPNHEHFLADKWVEVDDSVTGVGATYESTYIFTLGSIWRLFGTDTETLGGISLSKLHDDIGSRSPVLSRGNRLYFMDVGRGPIRMNIDGTVDELFGIKLRDFWRDEVNKDMLAFLPIESDDEEGLLYFYVATGTRPYATHVLVFDEVVNQWSILSIHGITAAGSIQNQFGKRKVAFGTLTGDLFQHGEESDQSLGAYTGTLTGNPTTIGGNTLVDATATFNAEELPGSTLLIEDSDGDLLYSGMVVARVDANTLRVHPSFPSSVSTADTYLLGGIEAYWQTREEDFGEPGGKKILKSLRLGYIPQDAGTLNVQISIDGGAWEDLTGVDLTGDGAAKLWVNRRCTTTKIRVRLSTPGRPWHIVSFIAEGVVVGRPE